MTPWKLSIDGLSATRYLDDGISMESRMIESIPEEELATAIPADPTLNPRISEIKSELASLDIRRIRPLAEGDTSYLATLNAQVLALRTELATLLAGVA
jgi:hypothetical protein